MTKTTVQEESEEDKELKEELRLLVQRITGTDTKLIPPALDMLSYLIRTSTTSMTSVPKPLKYLAPYYLSIKDAHSKMKNPEVNKQCSDIISVLAMGASGGDIARDQRDCLRYCLLGTMKNVGDWGHEYIRQLELEIVDQWAVCPKSADNLLPLVEDILDFDCSHHAEIQACDLVMEIDKLHLLANRIEKSTYERMCLYLASCAKYVEDIEAKKILALVGQQYSRFGDSPKALIIAMQLHDKDWVNKIFADCKDVTVQKQMAFIAARQQYQVELDQNIPEREELLNILSNSHLSSHFQTLARELDIMEPKAPEEVYKSWLEPVPAHPPSILGEPIDSARQNLASSFVNAFVNAGFGTDKLLTPDGGNKWIYRNKDHAMLSATAALGLIHIWDVDGGLTPIDKYLYTSDEHIKAGALLALGIVNCRVKNECEPALALLAEFVNNSSQTLRTGAVFGLGLAYVGTARSDVLKLLLPSVESAVGVESLAAACLACGLVAVGTCNSEVCNAIIAKLMDARETEVLKSPHMHLVVLGLALSFLGCKEAIEAPSAALEVMTEPFRTTSQTILQMCAYAGTGDVLIVQELLHLVSERIVIPEVKKPITPEKSPKDKDKRKLKREWDPSITQAVAALSVAVVSIGEETGAEMCQRILGNMGRYGDVGVRRAVPLAIALTSISKPHLPVIDVLTKYSHDSDEEVACNAIFCLGIVGAGTNNARLAASLRQLAVYHMRNPAQLFMVRLAQGLTHLGKGTLTINPFHTDRQLMDRSAMAGLLITLVSLLDTHTLILGRNHYLLFSLATAMQPRWLLALDEHLEPISVPVRVGQAVDTVAKAGTPKTIAGIHTHSTPVLLAVGERAELATDQYEQLCPTLDGICILKKKPEKS